MSSATSSPSTVAFDSAVPTARLACVLTAPTACKQPGDERPGGQAKYRDALTKMVLKTPTGDVRLDANRQAIGTTFVTEVVKDAQGNLFNKVLRKVDSVDQTLGMKKEDFQMGSRDVPACP